MPNSTNESDQIRETLRSHLWSDTPYQTCGCGWSADAAWMVDPRRPNRVEQWLSHVAAAIRDVVVSPGVTA